MLYSTDMLCRYVENEKYEHWEWTKIFLANMCMTLFGSFVNSQ